MTLKKKQSLLEVLCKQNMEHCFQEGVEEHRLRDPSGMAMNSKGQLIIVESYKSKVKVFDRRKQFVDCFSLPVHNQVRLQVFDVAVDLNDNIYVLVSLHERSDPGFEFVVYMLNKNGEVHHQFPVKGDGEWSCFTFMIVDSKRKVVIAHTRKFEESCLLDVYENDGQFVRRFGEGLLRFVTDLALATDDRVIVLDEGYCVHMFSEHGDHLSEFQLSTWHLSTRGIAFHHSSEHVVVAELELDYVYLHIYTNDGELVHSIKTHVNGIRPFQRGMIVTAEGHVTLLISDLALVNVPGRVFMLC